MEQRVRGAIGIVLLVAALFIQWPGAWNGILGVVGAVLLATALFRYCPVKQLIGRNAG